MNSPLIEFSKKVEWLWVKEGEAFTVYFRPPEPNNIVQIELRNTEEFGLEIFVDSPLVTVKSFDVWKETK